MANTKSAAKRARQTPQRTARNKAVKATVRTYVRKAREAVETKTEQGPEALREAIAQLDKAASKGIIHKRNAQRRISRLTLLANKTTAAAPQA